MEEEIRVNRGFKGIWIPKEIWLNTELTMQEKVFLVEIDSLDNEEGCTAGNQYFANFFGISKTRVSLVIQQLINKGYIKSKLVYKEGTKQILYRVLNICRPPYPTFVIEGMQQKLNTPIQQKLKDNNTNNNNTNNNKERKKETTYDKVINELITNEEIKELLYEFIKMRTLKKKPLTDRALKIQINKLKKISQNEEEQKQIIEKSIVKNWDEFYPIKDYEKGANNGTNKKSNGSEFAEFI